jgi:carboxymethylenebutenolidase
MQEKNWPRRTFSYDIEYGAERGEGTISLRSEFARELENQAAAEQKLETEGTLIEQAIEGRTPDGISDSVLYHSEDGRRLPGVIFLTDIGGIRPSQRQMAQRVASEGYTVLVPNVFYRTRRPPMFDFPVKMGEEGTMKRIAELSGPLTPETVERDASAYVDFLAAHESVREGAMGVVGYCFSGGLAMRTAAARPDRIAAAASFHGGRLFTDSSTSPHLVLPRIKARLYFGHAT